MKLAARAGLVVVGLLVVHGAAQALAAPAPAESPAEDNVERVLLLAPGRPLRVDLIVTLDGQPQRQIWRARVDELMDAVARDGRFTVEEVARIGEMVGGEFGAEPNRTRLAELARALPAVEGKIERQVLVDFLESVAPPFTIASGTAPGSVAAPALFALIDRDSDGRLSSAELTGGAKALAVRDFDGDQLITERELIIDPTQRAQRSTEEEFLENRVAPKDENLIWLRSKKVADQLGTLLLQRFDHDSDGALALRGAAVELTLPPETATQIDLNNDGRLDVDELQGWATQPAEIVLPMAFGKTSASRAAPSSPGASDVRVRKKLDGGFKVYLEDVQIDVQRNNRDPSQNNGPDLRFTRYDADKNGYLDMQEARANPLLVAGFVGMDTDNDSMVMPSEFQAYVEAQNASAATRLRLRMIDRGQDLFAVLDVNGDGLLTPRELHDAVALLESEDRDGDGMLSGTEIPARWSLELSRGSSRSTDVQAGRPRVRSKQLAASDAGPVWFRKMDGNHDGDLSDREFLGPPAEFARADANHDGLVDVSEALAAWPASDNASTSEQKPEKK